MSDIASKKVDDACKKASILANISLFGDDNYSAILTHSWGIAHRELEKLVSIMRRNNKITMCSNSIYYIQKEWGGVISLKPIIKVRQVFYLSVSTDTATSTFFVAFSKRSSNQFRFFHSLNIIDKL